MPGQQLLDLFQGLRPGQFFKNMTQVAVGLAVPLRLQGLIEFPARMGEAADLDQPVFRAHRVVSP